MHKSVWFDFLNFNIFLGKLIFFPYAVFFFPLMQFSLCKTDSWILNKNISHSQQVIFTLATKNGPRSNSFNLFSYFQILFGKQKLLH